MAPAGRQEPPLEIADFAGRITLISGEVKTGKTALLSRILGLFLEQGRTGLVVLDLAPDLTQGIGGKMALPGAPGLRVYSPSLAPPRLRGGDDLQEVLRLAEANALAVERVMAEYLARPGQSLFINDVSMYLQAREPAGLEPLLSATPTVVMNGYHGSALGGGEFGDRERGRMRALAARCHHVISL